MNYSLSLTKAQAEARALGKRLHGKARKPDTRSRVALGCFAIAHQHHSAIITLLSRPLPMQASAFALLRPLAESTFRGFWVALCASEEKIGNILTGEKKQVDTATIVRELLDAVGQGSKHPAFYQRVWPSLSAYVHTYEESLFPWLRGQNIEPKFTELELNSLLQRVSLTAKLIETGALLLLVQPGEAAQPEGRSLRT